MISRIAAAVFFVGLLFFKRKPDDGASETEVPAGSEWYDPPFDCPDTRFETGPAELVTQPLEDDVRVTRPRSKG